MQPSAAFDDALLHESLRVLQAPIWQQPRPPVGLLLPPVPMPTPSPPVPPALSLTPSALQAEAELTDEQQARLLAGIHLVLHSTATQQPLQQHQCRVLALGVWQWRGLSHALAGGSG